MVRRRGLLDAAFRADQDRLRDLGCAPAGGAPHGAGVAAGDADSAGAGGGHRAGPHRRPARPWPDRVDEHHPARPAVVRRSAVAGVPQFAVRRDRGGRGPGGVGGLPLRPGAVVAGPGSGPPGLGLSGPPGQVRAGQRRYFRRWTGAGHREVELPAQRPQRLHLRDHRRGTRPGRRARPARPVRVVRLHRDADRAPLGRPVPAAADRDHHAVGDRSVVHQRRLRDRPAARHRHPAAADFCRWNIHGHNTFDDRHDGQRGASRTRGGRCAARRPRRPDDPHPAAATAGALLADPGRGAARPAARQAEAGQAAAQAATGPRSPKGQTASGGQARRTGRASCRRTAIHRPAPSAGPSGTGRSALRVNDSVREPTGASSLSVVLAGGGTAGHVEPAMAVADALVSLDPDVRITALGTARGLETRLVPERGYQLELITPVPLPRKPTGDLARLPARLLRAVRQARAVLDKVDADVVIGFGGYVSLPAYLAARGTVRRGRRVPVVIHEANASAGLANRVGARGAHRILSAVTDPGLRGAEVVGVPVRETITSLDRAALRSTARAHFGFADDARVLLVFGGSQGAASVNRAVAAAAGDLAAAGVAVLHAHGAKNTI